MRTEPELTDEFARLLAQEQAARTAAERVQRQLTFLAEASSVLAASLDYETTLAGIAHLAVPFLADWCLIDLLTPDGQLRRVASAHADPSKQRLIEELAERYPLDADARHGAPRVIRTGEPEMASEASPEVMRRMARDADHLRLLQQINLTSSMCVPLTARGRTFGAITLLAGDSGRRFDKEDLDLAQQLARRAALAVDNARLFTEEQAARSQAEEAQRHLAFLAQATSLLASSLDYETTLERVAQLAVPAIADWCAVDVVGEGGELVRLAVAHADPAKIEWAREMQRRYPPRPDAPRGVPNVIRTGEPELYPEISEELLRANSYDEEHFELVRTVGLTSGMIVPLAARGRTLGAITFASTDPSRRYDEDDLVLARDVAQRSALAVDNARLFREAQEAEQRFRDLVESLEVVVWEADVRSGQVTFANRRIEDLFGYPLERWLSEGSFWFSVIHPDDSDATLEERRRAIKEVRTVDQEYRAVKADGRRIWVRDVVHVITDGDGRPSELRGVTFDITARRQTEMRLQAEHAVTRVLAEAATLDEATPRIMQTICETLGWDVGALWKLDDGAATLRCVEVWLAPRVHAPSFAALTREFRYSPGIGLPGRVWAEGRPVWIRDVVPDDNFPRAPTAAREGLHAAFGFPISSDRFLGVMEFFSSEIREPDEELLAMMGTIGPQIGQFIERKRAERALAEREEQLQFQNALLASESETSMEGILVVSPEGRVLSFNRRFFDMWEIPQELAESRSDAALLDFVAERLANPEEFRTRVAYLYEHPDEASRDEIVLKDGRILDRWSAPLRGAGGVLYGRAWYFRDITEQKHAEHMLRENEERAAFLAESSSILATSLDYQATLEGVARLAVPYLADWCVVDVVELDGSVRRVAIAHSDPSKAALARSLELNRHYDIDPEAEHGVPKVLRTGQAEFAPEIPETWLEAVSENEEYLNLLRQMGFKAYICVPLSARGRTLGAITLVTAESGRSYGPTELALAEELARRAALALDNARLYRERSEVARTLQQSLLPPRLPEIPGIDIAGRYHSAVEGTDVGGDFYDLFQTRRNQWAVVIGDVCGKGAEAAAITALARYTVRASAMQATRPARILAMLNDALRHHGSETRFCTVAYARVEPTEGAARLQISCGGHPPPLIVRASGEVEPAALPGTLLGLFPDPSLSQQTADLAVGDAIVFYTDGVTEARGPDGHFGEERFRDVLRSCAGLDAADMAERIERTALDFQEGRPRDDVAVLVLRILA